MGLGVGLETVKSEPAAVKLPEMPVLRHHGRRDTGNVKPFLLSSAILLSLDAGTSLLHF